MIGKSDSLRNQVFEEWVKNPYTTAQKICDIHGWNYIAKQNYINRLLSDFRSYTDLGLPQEPLRLEHRTFEWKCVSRTGLMGQISDEMPLTVWKAGWRISHGNRNEMWVFNDDLGSVHWYKKGLVLLYLKGELQQAKVKELFCKALSFMPQDIAFFEKYLNVPLKEVYRKWIFDMGKPVPKFDIRTFERSHGLRIFTDLSHPQAVHVGENQPFWLDEQRQANSEQHQMVSEFGQVVTQFGVEIKEHLELIKIWQEEAKESRVTRSIEPQTVEKKNFPYQYVGDASFSETEENDFLHEY